mmetsp:Transcript_38503/g.111040  ORF Transcript_38503/g.111040 Transcript_38503/m.111040 type:complete len:233 (+) Transcript_38503:625-1323(+)
MRMRSTTSFLICIMSSWLTPLSIMYLCRSPNLADCSFRAARYCAVSADNIEINEPKKMKPISKHKTLKVRSAVFRGTTSMEPGVICVMLQCKAVRYSYEKVASIMTVESAAVRTMSESIHERPVSLGALKASQTQTQASTWFKYTMAIMSEVMFMAARAPPPEPRSRSVCITFVTRLSLDAVATRRSRATFKIRLALKNRTQRSSSEGIENATKLIQSRRTKGKSRRNQVFM